MSHLITILTYIEGHMNIYLTDVCEGQERPNQTSNPPGFCMGPNTTHVSSLNQAGFMFLFHFLLGPHPDPQ